MVRWFFMRWSGTALSGTACNDSGQQPTNHRFMISDNTANPTQLEDNTAKQSELDDNIHSQPITGGR